MVSLFLLVIVRFCSDLCCLRVQSRFSTFSLGAFLRFGAIELFLLDLLRQVALLGD